MHSVYAHEIEDYSRADGPTPKKGHENEAVEHILKEVVINQRSHYMQWISKPNVI